MKNQVYAIILLLLVGCHSFNEHDLMTQHAAMANVKLAVALLRMGNLKGAKEKMLLAQQLDNKNPMVWYTQGYLSERAGDLQLAKLHYLHAIALKPKNGAAQNNYGAFLCRLGDYRNSIKHFLIAAEDPYYLDVGSAFENAGLCALRIPDNKLAITFFKKAVHHDPNLTLSKKYYNSEPN